MQGYSAEYVDSDLCNYGAVLRVHAVGEESPGLEGGAAGGCCDADSLTRNRALLHIKYDVFALYCAYIFGACMTRVVDCVKN
jgi:hypothetical protein